MSWYNIRQKTVPIKVILLVLLCLSPIVSPAQEIGNALGGLEELLLIIGLIILATIIILVTNWRANEERVASNLIGLLVSIMMFILSIMALFNGMKLEGGPAVYIIFLILSIINLVYHMMPNKEKN